MFDLRTHLIAFWLFGLRVSLAPAGAVSFAGLAVVCALLAGWRPGLSLGAALLAGVLSSLIFFVSELLHQLGHAWAARRTGYPMTGIHFFLVLAASRYPPDEPELAPSLHVRRALGGFWVNILLGLLFVPVALALWPRGAEILPTLPSLVAWLAAFTAVINLFILGLGALVPLRLPGGGVTDGATLLRYRGR